tara:strand:- start:3850 stop:5715 length:1866 start_codon:yes stop_codon:yes gene_type:complete
MNRYPLWKNILVLLVLSFGIIYALPNLYGDDPALQITREDGGSIIESTLTSIEDTLETKQINFLDVSIEDDAIVTRFQNVESQLEAIAVLSEDLPYHVVALTLAPRTPPILKYFGLQPMSLGLDLRGGVHFLYQVDLDTAIDQYLQSFESDLRTNLRESGIRNRIRVNQDIIEIPIIEDSQFDSAGDIIRRLDPSLDISTENFGEERGYLVALSDVQITERQNFAIQQNTITLRNRVNELGVAEPIVQRQGLNRIVVQLPGVQDPSQAERILGATATLEFRLVDSDSDAFAAESTGRIPLNSILRYREDGSPVLLRRDVIVSGDQLTDASFSYSQGVPAVSVRLNNQGATSMLETTQANLNRPMAVLYIEEKPEIIDRDGEEIIINTREETVINTATIRGVFSSNFQITGVSPFEGQDLAILLRSGALATPIIKVEERTIGPSLGQDNIEKGRAAVIIGFLLVILFMLFYYRIFGLVANLALCLNLVLIIALLSLLQASLTLPGIAGIVLTVGMAVDANVLIFERIKEELSNKNSPQASIRAGYDKAFSTIADANITTLIAALVLFSFGTGPIKGFAVTLALGIVTSMFTAIIGTRALVNLIYGYRSTKYLSIGSLKRYAN